jgi:hypothetical protein
MKEDEIEGLCNTNGNSRNVTWKMYRGTWEDIISVYLHETGHEVVDWIHLA